MGKYSPLADFLRAQGRDEVPMTFAEIERIVGSSLPRSHRYRSWWSNNSFNSVMTKVWLDAGFRSADVDIKRRNLVFRKVGPQGPTGSAPVAGRRANRATLSSRHRHILQWTDRPP